MIRGMHKTMADGRLYVVNDNQLLEVFVNGTAQVLGTIAGYGRVGMADNGAQLCIVAGATGYIYTVKDGLSTITDSAFDGANTVTFLDGFFIFNSIRNGRKDRFFISDLLDGTTYDELDFATAERYPDSIVRVFSDHTDLILFGSETIEMWFNSGNADFPFTPSQSGAIEQGLGARWTVEKVDESVIWLDHEGMVRRLSGLTPQRISTHAVEYDIKKGDWRNAYSLSYVDEGHQFYVLTVPAANLSQKASTWVFDAATGEWHKRKSYDLDYWRIGFYANAFNKHVCGDSILPQIYDMNLDFYDENGEPLIAEMTFPQVENDGKRFTVHSFQVDMEVGVGNSDDTDPQVMLDVSRNTKTFDMTQPWRSFGKVGEYDKRVIWRRLGQHRSFTPKVRISAPVKKAVIAAYAEITPDA